MSFPPHKPQKIQLQTGHLTTILGENLDVGNGERNGVGKSAIFDAIQYLYWGKTQRVSNGDLLNYIERGPMFVSGSAQRNGIAFYVERGDSPSVLRLFEKPADDPREFRTKEAGKLVFETTKSSKPETTKRIIELVGFDLKLTDVLLVNNPSDRSCFFLKNEEDQRNIIERLFGFTVFTEKAEQLRELRKEENKNLNTKESALIATRQANDRILVEIAQLEEKSNAWAVQKDNMIRLVSQKIGSYQKIDFKNEIEILSQAKKLAAKLVEVEQEQRTQQTSLTALKHKHQRWETEQHTLKEGLQKSIAERQEIDAAAEAETIGLRLRIEAEIQSLLAEIEAAQRERDPYKKSVEQNFAQKARITKQTNITEQEIIQLNESKCPTCGQDWLDTKDHVLKCIEELDLQTAEIAKLDAEINELKNTVRQIEQKIDKLEMKVRSLVTELDELPKTFYQTIEDATRASTSLDGLVKTLNDAEIAENPHVELMNDIVAHISDCEMRCGEIRELALALPQTSNKTYDQAVIDKTELENLQHQYAELRKTDNPYRDTIDNLRNKTMKEVDDTEVTALRWRVEHMHLLISLLADKDSPIRKAVLHEWVPELNARVNNYLEFLELPHRVQFDNNMTAKFIVNNQSLSFGSLSTGQRLRVWLATNRAFREIFELINFKINVFFVDELLDKGMSPRGAEVSYALLEQMVNTGRSVFLITHRSELNDLSDHTLTVQLENGLSCIV